MSIFHSGKIEKILAERGLSNVSDDVAYQSEAILSELDRKNLLRDSKRLNLNDRADEEKIAYLRALVEQNWIIIKQQSELLSALQKQPTHKS